MVSVLRKTVRSGVEHGVGESGEIRGGGKHSSVPGYATEDAGVFVLHFSLDEAMTEAAIIGCRRDLGANLFRWIKSCVDHAERSKEFALAEAIQRFIGDAFEGDAKEDESDVAIVGAGAGIGSERRGEGGLKQFVACVRLQE